MMIYVRVHAFGADTSNADVKKVAFGHSWAVARNVLRVGWMTSNSLPRPHVAPSCERPALDIA